MEKNSMTCLRACFAVLAALSVAVAVAGPACAQQRLPDSTLYTTYYAGNPATQINWSVCGSTPQTEGCYGHGNFGPFTNACSIVQSVPAPINLNTVLRYIYILDEGATLGSATLSIYRRTDMVTQTYDFTTITQLAVVPLTGLVAGPGATCAMVQNPTNVYATTYQGQSVAVINKTSFAVSYVGGFGTNVSSITADSYGFVTIDWGSGFGDENAEYGPDGRLQGSGGGTYWMINPIDGVNPSSFPQFDASSSPQVGYRMKATR